MKYSRPNHKISIAIHFQKVQLLNFIKYILIYAQSCNAGVSKLIKATRTTSYYGLLNPIQSSIPINLVTNNLGTNERREALSKQLRRRKSLTHRTLCKTRPIRGQQAPEQQDRAAIMQNPEGKTTRIHLYSTNAI